MLLSITLCFFLVGRGQTFSKRVDNSLTSVHQHVLIQPYGYQTIGLGYDSIDGSLEIPTFVKGFDFNGNELYVKKYYFEDYWWPLGFDCNVRLNDSTVLFMAFEYSSLTDTIHNVVVWMNNYGDTLMTRRYHSPFYVASIPVSAHFVPYSMTTSTDGQFIYFVSHIGQGNPPQNNFLIKKLTAQGDEVWTYVNPISPYYYYCTASEYFNGQIWFQIAGEYNKLKSLNDTTGIVDFNVELNGADYPLYQANDMIMDDEGVATACIKVNEDFDVKPAIYKMNYDGNYIWHTIPNDGDYEQLQYADHLAQSQDGGYVSCSVKYEELPNPDNPNDPSANNNNSLIWLWKVDANGALQWERNYEYFSFDSTNYYHIKSIAHDFKATPDGGFIAAGESYAWCSDYPTCDNFTQQGWLLKVDGCGCLVPGCDQNCVVGIEELANSEGRSVWFLVGPNPARDMLNVYLRLTPALSGGEGVVLVVHDILGNLVGSFVLKHDDTTYMIDTTSLASGQYVVSLVVDNVVLQSEKIVVAR
jgi:hypothetical protein